MRDITNKMLNRKLRRQTQLQNDPPQHTPQPQEENPRNQQIQNVAVEIIQNKAPTENTALPTSSANAQNILKKKQFRSFSASSSKSKERIKQNSNIQRATAETFQKSPEKIPFQPNERPCFIPNQNDKKLQSENRAQILVRRMSFQEKRTVQQDAEQQEIDLMQLSHVQLFGKKVSRLTQKDNAQKKKNQKLEAEITASNAKQQAKEKKNAEQQKKAEKENNELRQQLIYQQGRAEKHKEKKKARTTEFQEQQQKAIEEKQTHENEKKLFKQELEKQQKQIEQLQEQYNFEHTKAEEQRLTQLQMEQELREELLSKNQQLQATIAELHAKQPAVEEKNELQQQLEFQAEQQTANLVESFCIEAGESGTPENPAVVNGQSQGEHPQPVDPMKQSFCKVSLDCILEKTTLEDFINPEKTIALTENDHVEMVTELIQHLENHPGNAFQEGTFVIEDPDHHLFELLTRFQCYKRLSTHLTEIKIKEWECGLDVNTICNLQGEAPREKRTVLFTPFKSTYTRLLMIKPENYSCNWKAGKLWESFLHLQEAAFPKSTATGLERKERIPEEITKTFTTMVNQLVDQTNDPLTRQEGNEWIEKSKAWGISAMNKFCRKYDMHKATKQFRTDLKRKFGHVKRRIGNEVFLTKEELQKQISQTQSVKKMQFNSTEERNLKAKHVIKTLSRIHQNNVTGKPVLYIEGLELLRKLLKDNQFNEDQKNVLSSIYKFFNEYKEDQAISSKGLNLLRSFNIPNDFDFTTLLHPRDAEILTCVFNGKWPYPDQEENFQNFMNKYENNNALLTHMKQFEEETLREITPSSLQFNQHEKLLIDAAMELKEMIDLVIDKTAFNQLNAEEPWQIHNSAHFQLLYEILMSEPKSTFIQVVKDTVRAQKLEYHNNNQEIENDKEMLLQELKELNKTDVPQWKSKSFLIFINQSFDALINAMLIRAGQAGQDNDCQIIGHNDPDNEEITIQSTNNPLSNPSPVVVVKKIMPYTLEKVMQEQKKRLFEGHVTREATFENISGEYKMKNSNITIDLKKAAE